MLFQGYLKQSTQVTKTVLMVDSADHITGKTGLAAGLTIIQTKLGTLTGTITPTVAEISTSLAKGLYSLVLTTTHTDTVGETVLHITGTGADPADYKFEVSARLLDDLCFPTTSGRGLDVTATGEAGLDFANVNVPLGVVPIAAIVDNGTLQSATSTTAVLRSAASFGANNRPNGMTLYIYGGTGAGQSRIITAYTDATDTATVDTWTTTPDNTSTYIIYPTPPGSTSSPAPVNAVQAGGQSLTVAAPVTIPSSLASPTNISAGTLSVVNSLLAVAPNIIVGQTVAAVAGAVASVTGNVGGGTINVVNSLLAIGPNAVNAAAIASGAFTNAKFAAGAVDAAALATDAAQEIADALLDRADAIESGLTLRNATRLIAAACAGKASGLATTTAVYRNAVADSKDRITATVDANGNRTGVTTDLT